MNLLWNLSILMEMSEDFYKRTYPICKIQGRASRYLQVTDHQRLRMRHLMTTTGILIFSAGLIAGRPSVTLPPSSVQPASEAQVITTSEVDKEEILNMSQKNVNEKQTETWKPTESNLDSPNYFEGDLDIPQEMIDAFYDNPIDTDDETGTQTTQAATSNWNFLWPNGIVYYTYHTSIDTATQMLILGAIAEIERETCLQFQFRRNRHRIEFSGEGDGCSTTLGRTGGRQVIYLPETSVGTCRTHRIVLHEIGHALGMWHEQSRPDRNQYVEVLYQNVQPGLAPQFEAKRSSETNNHRELYDYASVMHYRLDEFSRNGAPTMRRRTTATANSTYISQGRPNIGREDHLSTSDISQLNQMYSCPGHVLSGRLRIYARYGSGLPDRDGWFAGDSDPYVRVTTYNHNGYSVSLHTRTDRGDQSPEWNQWLDFSVNTWRIFTVQVFDDNFGRHDTLSDISTHSFTQHVSRTYQRKNCYSGYIYYDYFFR